MFKKFSFNYAHLSGDLKIVLSIKSLLGNRSVKCITRKTQLGWPKQIIIGHKVKAYIVRLS